MLRSDVDMCVFNAAVHHSQALRGQSSHHRDRPPTEQQVQLPMPVRGWWSRWTGRWMTLPTWRNVWRSSSTTLVWSVC